jgi:hypothetical protein
MLLADIGVLQTGYVNVSLKRNATFLRLPWVRKDKEWKQF